MLDRARTAVLATVRADGRPHAAPIWLDFSGDVLIFMTGESTVKGRNMPAIPASAFASTRKNSHSTSS